MLQSSLGDQIPQIILFKEITLKLREKKNTRVFEALVLCAHPAPLLLLYSITQVPRLFYESLVMTTRGTNRTHDKLYLNVTALPFIKQSWRMRLSFCSFFNTITYAFFVAVS